MSVSGDGYSKPEIFLKSWGYAGRQPIVNTFESPGKSIIWEVSGKKLGEGSREAQCRRMKGTR